jgi:HD superfamily phosphohydrolase
MARQRRIRTIFYGDQAFTPAELELLHTPALQRLYDLHQLGLTDRVFIDASHSRLHHVVGVVYHADKLISAIAKNLREEAEAHVRTSLRIGPPDAERDEPVVALVKHVEQRRGAARLMGLLHDLTHAPYGHTLEDEIGLVESKHDEPDRQAEAFYHLLCQLIGWLARENSGDVPQGAALSSYIDDSVSNPPAVGEVIPVAVALLGSPMGAHRMAHDFGPAALAQLLRDLHLAMQGLLRMELLHKTEDKLQRNPRLLPRVEPYAFETLIRESLQRAKQPRADRFDPYKDAFLIDLIGNTVCADLLDYAQRDAHFTNIKTAYDPDRIVESFTLVAFSSEHRNIHRGDGRLPDDPFFGKVLRPAIALFIHKLRTDIPSGVMDLLHSRYDLYERALYHSTKCIAGAMLGRALQLVSLKPLPSHMVFLGDRVFLYEAVQAARLLRSLLAEATTPENGSAAVLDSQIVQRFGNRLDAMPSMSIVKTARTLMENRVRRAGDHAMPLTEFVKELDGGVRLLDALFARRFHRTVFRLLPNDKKAEHAYEAADAKKAHTQVIAEFFCDADNRIETEMAIEDAGHLPRGSVVIHCPPYGGPAKVADVLLLARKSDGTEEHAALRKAGELQDKIFEHHVKAIGALEKMYWSTWRLTVSVSPPHFLNWKSLGNTISHEMASMLVEKKKFTLIDLRNDPTMIAELKMATDRIQVPEETIVETQGDAGPDSGKLHIREPRPITHDDVESLIFPYGIRSHDRMVVKHQTIPEFLERVETLVGGQPDRLSRLAALLLARRTAHPLHFNRVDDEQIRNGLNQVLTELEQELNG